ncbi:hypothetical protein RZE82_06485 [Mollicutes bacterium LVI A0039]|nr:hypothetical protein RZE82_06485 [Mollicutes bacterium LVI A0039]
MYKTNVKSEEMEVIGTSHKEPGNIKVEIDGELLQQNLNSIFSEKITELQEEKLNEILLEKFGIANVVESGKTVLDTIKNIKKVLDPEKSQVNMQLIIISLIVDPTMSVLNWEDMFAVSDGKVIKTINTASKLGQLSIPIIVKNTKSKWTPVIILLLSMISDSMISDDEEFDIFTITDSGDIQWNLDLKTENGESRYFSGTIEINYDNAINLYNNVATHIETSKLLMLKELNTLINNRGTIINNVVNYLDTKLENVATHTDENELKALCEIYGITRLNFLQYAKVIDYTGGMTCNEDECYVIWMNCKYVDKHRRDISYSMYKDTRSNYPYNQALEDKEYEGELSINEVVYISDFYIDLSLLQTHGNNFIKSYYNTHIGNQAHIDFVRKLTNKDWISTGEVDLWRDLSYEIINLNYTDNTSYKELNNEIAKSNTNFMSNERIEVCKYAVQLLYSDIMTILSEYSTVSDDIEAKEKEIVDLWKN